MKTCGYCGKEFLNAAGLSSHEKFKHRRQLFFVPHQVGDASTSNPDADDPVTTIRRVKSVASEVGGLSALGEIVEALS
jgi:hypothetical protein